MNGHAFNSSSHTSQDGRLRRLLARRKRVLALLRASRRTAVTGATGGYRSQYAASLWALSEDQAPLEEPGPDF